MDIINKEELFTPVYTNLKKGMETLYKKMKRNNKYALTTTLNRTLIRYTQRVVLAFPDQHSRFVVCSYSNSDPCSCWAHKHLNKLFQYISMYLEYLILKSGFLNLFLNQNIQAFGSLIFGYLTPTYTKHIKMMLKSHKYINYNLYIIYLHIRNYKIQFL